MAAIMQLVNWAMSSGPAMVTAIISVLSGLIAIALLIPGDQPEKALQGAVDFLKKLSLK